MKSMGNIQNPIKKWERGSYFLCAAILFFALCFPLSAMAQTGGQTANNVSGWTVDTLKEHQADMDALRQKFMDERQVASDKEHDSKILAVKESAALALASAKEANTKSESQSDKRFDSVNEFRKTLSDQTISFIPRPEFNQAINGLNDKMDANTKLIMARVDLLSNRVVEATGSQAGSANVWMTVGTIVMLILVGIGSLAAISVRRRTINITPNRATPRTKEKTR
jgi:hypothetical protein